MELVYNFRKKSITTRFRRTGIRWKM